jgi:hypothetical protein
VVVDADVSDVHVASIFTVEVFSFASCCVYVYACIEFWCFEKERGKGDIVGLVPYLG